MSSVSMCVALVGCNTFFAEVSVERLCHQQAVHLEPQGLAGMQHVVLTSNFDVSKQVPTDDHLSFSLTVDQATLAAVDAGTLPYVAHAALSLVPPEGSGLQLVQLIDYHSAPAADAGTPQGSITAQCAPVEVLQYARAGLLDGQLVLDVDVPPGAVDATVEVCGELTARYDL